MPRIMQAFLGAALALLAIACATQAAPVPTAAMDPPPKADASASGLQLQDIDISHEEFTLDNGLRVIVHTDRKAPIVAMNTWYHVGSKDEPEGKTGFAHLFEHLMFQGSANYNDEYFKALNEVGATGINGTTNFDRTNYFQTVPTGALERMLWLESDRLTHLLDAIDQAKLDEQRDVVKNEKRQRENQPFGKQWDYVFRGIFPPGHPYRHSVIGSMEDLDAATLEDVYDWFERYYGASNVVVVLAGDIDAATARPLMEKYYGDAPTGQPVARLKQWVPRLTEIRREVLYDRAATGFIRRIWPIPPGPRAATELSLWGSALASGRTAPLYKALVEEHRLASSVNAGPSEFEVASLFIVSAELLPGADPDKAREVLDETFAAFLGSGPDPERLERLRTQTLTSVVRGFESAAAKASTLISGAVFADNPSLFKQSLTAVQEATAQSLAERAGAWLTRPYYELTGLPFPDYAGAESGADRSTLPGAAPPASLNFPPVQERALDNGIRIVLARRENLPVTDLILRFDLGSASESQRDQGVSRIAFEQLLSGTTSRDAAAISAEAERLGSFVRASSYSLVSEVSAGGLTAKLPEILALVADVLSNPTFPEDQFALASDRWAASIQRSRTNPSSVASIALEERVYGPSHPYGRRMTEQAVQRLSPKKAADFHRSCILGQPFTLFAVGDIGMDQLARQLADAFPNWSAEAAPCKPPEVDPAPRPEQPRLFLINMPGTPQSVILAGHAAPATTVEPNVPDLLANQMLGGSFVSRVNLNLREDKGWSYGARTGLESDRFQPMFSVSAPVQVDKTAQALAELRRELSEYISDRPATVEEFDQAQQRNLRALSGQYETGRAVLGSLVRSANLGRSWDYPIRYGEALQSVALEEVRDAARALIEPNRLTWVVVGDLSQFEDEVRALGIGETLIINAQGQPAEATDEAPSA